ncbi:MAG TPA: protein kinase, partial [Myxococcales bacterium]|nr:protein kinase [Myxococcales bacterium]
MPIAQAAYIASKICEGLDYAHRKKDGRGSDLGIIHRDVSPQNVLISYEGEVKIIDFGIAKAAGRSHKTQAGILKGKFAYMSPEQVQGKSIDRRSDIFAVGNILFEMLTGERLFVGGSDFSVVEKVRNAEVPSVREIDPEIPVGLEQILYRALARDLNERYQWASEMQEDLLRFQLVGDTIYSSKNLSVFMKEAFAEDLGREHSRMERFTTVQRPPELDPSMVTQSPLQAPPRPPALGPSSQLRPPARRPGSSSNPHGTPHAAAVAQAAAGVEEPSITVDPSIPSFQYLPTDQTAVNEHGKRSDTFIPPDSRDHRRVERGEQVEIGRARPELIDAATMPRPAYAPAPRPSGAPVNGGRADDEPPPWPSLEGRGETQISQAPPPPPKPAPRREGAGRQPTPKPGPRPAVGDAKVPITDVSQDKLPRVASTEEVEDSGVRRTVADMPAALVPGPMEARSGGGREFGLLDDALPEPPRAIPSVTDVGVPQLPPEPVTAHGEETGEHTSLDARTTTEAIALPAPEPEPPTATPGVVPLPAPFTAEAGGMELLDAAAQTDASDSVIGKALDAMLPEAVARSGSPVLVPLPLKDPALPLPAPTPSLSVSITAQPPQSMVDPLAATSLMGMADEDDPEVGPDEKTLARDIPALEEIRQRAAAEEAAELETSGQARTEMRAPEGWSPPEDRSPLPRAPSPSTSQPLGTVQREHTPTEGWDESSEPTGAGAGSGSGSVTSAGSARAEEEDEHPAWPSLEGRGETVIGVLPVPPPKKRPGSLRASAPKPRPKAGNYVVGQVDDSPTDEPSTSAERPRVLPPGGRPHAEHESVVTDLPVERSDASLPAYRPSASRSAVTLAPAGLDRRKLFVIGGSGAAALALVGTLALLLAGGSTAPVMIEVRAGKAPVRVTVDGEVVPNGQVTNVKVGDHELTASAPGFRPLKRRLTVGKSNSVVLERVQLEAASGSPASLPMPP